MWNKPTEPHRATKLSLCSLLQEQPVQGSLLPTAPQPVRTSLPRINTGRMQNALTNRLPHLLSQSAAILPIHQMTTTSFLVNGVSAEPVNGTHHRVGEWNKTRVG